MRTRLLLLSLSVIACSLFTPRPTPMDPNRPDDFSARYDWHEGSLPPPYHYEYTIEIDSSGGTVTMIPDYPGEGVPVWVESFEVTPAQLDALYTEVVEAGAFTTKWREVDFPPLGGAYYYIDLTAHGQTVRIPHFPPESQAATQARVSEAITSLVPEEVWATLEAQREAYMEANSE